MSWEDSAAALIFYATFYRTYVCTNFEWTAVDGSSFFYKKRH